MLPHTIALLLLAAAAASPASASAAGVTIKGKLEWPGERVCGKGDVKGWRNTGKNSFFLTTTTPHSADYPHPGDAIITLTPADPTLPPRTTWATVGGDFELYGAPAHASVSIDVSSPGLLFPRLALATGGDAIERAWYADAPDAGLLPTAPLTLRAVGKAAHFHEAPPFNLLAFLQTPYGMLLAFAAFAVFALPRMKLDPDELEELMSQARGGGGGDGAATAGAQPQLPAGRRPPVPGQGNGAQRRRAAQVVIEEVD